MENVESTFLTIPFLYKRKMFLYRVGNWKEERLFFDCGIYSDRVLWSEFVRNGKGNNGKHYCRSFEYVLDRLSPERQTVLLFHLDIFI